MCSPKRRPYRSVRRCRRSVTGSTASATRRGSPSGDPFPVEPRVRCVSPIVLSGSAASRGAWRMNMGGRLCGFPPISFSDFTPGERRSSRQMCRSGAGGSPLRRHSGFPQRTRSMQLLRSTAPRWLVRFPSPEGSASRRHTIARHCPTPEIRLSSLLPAFPRNRRS